MKLYRYAATLTLILYASIAFAATDAQKAFDALKALEGNWERMGTQGHMLRVSFRSTAGGSALISEIHGTGPENMITMFHLDGDRLMMTHYCGAGNQPRMLGKLAADGKSVSFEFLDATNLASPDVGHMYRVVFSMPDPDHHAEEWTFLDHGKEMKEVFTLQRSK